MIPITFDHDPTEQEIFSACYIALMKQGRRSSHGSKCLYRRFHDGKEFACAVGIFLDDETARVCDNQRITNFVTLVKENNIQFPNWMSQHSSFLRILQNIHDNANFLFKENFAHSMKSLAISYNLSIPELPQ